jgi:Tol biopolymer transport system component
MIAACRLFRWKWLGVVAALVATLAWNGLPAIHAASPIRLNGPLVAGGDVSEVGLQFSSDGSRVLYHADQTTDNVFEIFSVPSTGGTAVKLNGPLGAGGRVFSASLKFSPDGTRVLYQADQTTGTGHEVFSVPSAGGTAVKLNGPLVAGGSVDGAGLQFSPDGSRVLYWARQATNDVFEIFSVPSGGGTAVRLNGPLVAGGDVLVGAGAVSTSGLQFSADGSRVLYRADQTTDGVDEIFSVPSTGGTAVKLNGPLVAGGDVTFSRFSPDGSRVLYRADQTSDEVFEIFSVPTSGGTAVKLNGPLLAGGDVISQQFSPDGSRVLYRADQTSDEVFEIFSVPSAGGTAVRLNGPLVADGNVSGLGLQFSPDGSRVLYLADQTTNNMFELFSVPSTGGTAVKLNGPVATGVSDEGLQFSPDGSRVIYLADQTTVNVSEVFSVPSAGGTPVKLNGPLVAGGDASGLSLQFSPDGSRVLYLADQNTDEVDEVFIVPSTGGTAIKLNGPLVAGGDVSSSGLQFSPDGSRVLYLADQTTDNVAEIFVRVVRLRWDTAGGSWDAAANWDQAVTPDEVMQVFIDTPAVVTVTGDGVPRIVNELQVGGGSGASVLELRSDAVIAALNGFSIASGGVLRGDGVLDAGAAAVINPAGGEIRVGSGERLRVTSGAFTNAGRLESIGTGAALAELEFSGAVTNAGATGTISGRNAILRFNGGLTNEGSMALSFGTTDVVGDINNPSTGRIVVSGGSQATFYDDVVNNGTIQVSAGSTAVYFGAVSGAGSFPGTGTNFFEGDLQPGNSPAAVQVEGDLRLGPNAGLQIELGGTTAGAQYDQLQVGGLLSLDGALDVRLLDGFVPSYGSTFDLLEFGSLLGRFDTIELPALDGGLDWDTTSLYTTGTITAVPEPQSAILGFVALLFVYAARLMRRLRTACAMSTRLQSRSRP